MSSGLLQANDRQKLVGHNRQHSCASSEQPSSIHGSTSLMKTVQYPEYNIHYSLSALNREKRRHNRWCVCNRKMLHGCQRLTESGMFGDAVGGLSPSENSGCEEWTLQLKSVPNNTADKSLCPGRAGGHESHHISAVCVWSHRLFMTDDHLIKWTNAT